MRVSSWCDSSSALIVREYPEVRWSENEFKFQRGEGDYFFSYYIMLDEYFKCTD